MNYRSLQGKYIGENIPSAVRLPKNDGTDPEKRQLSNFNDTMANFTATEMVLSERLRQLN